MHKYILGFSILICQKIVIETNCIETHKVILNEHTNICMYVYNIIEAQNKSAQKKNCEFNMQYANSSKKISASIYTYLVYTFARTKAFMCVERYFSLFLHSLKVKYF